MNYKPGFIYIQSAAIAQMVAYSKKTGCVICEDKTVYSPKELQLFHEADAELDLATHLIKRIFGGEVVRIERNVEGNAEAQRIEGSKPEGGAHHPPAAGRLPPPRETSDGSENGELDIY
jgi:hypothetical protein